MKVYIVMATYPGDMSLSPHQVVVYVFTSKFAAESNCVVLNRRQREDSDVTYIVIEKDVL